jgi:phosphoenolpyruvate-protein phosphotransferase
MSERTFQGIAAAEGIAIGPAFCYRPLKLEIPARAAAGPEEEVRRFEAACRQAADELDTLKASVLARADAESAAIFDAHKLMVTDPMLRDAVQSRLEAGQIVEAAVSEAVQELAGMLAGMEDELFAARAVDMRDVGRRMLRILLGVTDTTADGLKRASVIVAHDLTPSDTAGLKPEMTLGFCTAGGGLTSHTAILARTLGLPAVVGLGQGKVDQITDGTGLVLDGIDGLVILSPTRSTLDRYEAARFRASARLEMIRSGAVKEAVTADGSRVEVGANIGDADSAREAVHFGAEGIGLLRTEFLYLQNTRPPGEEQQIAAYRGVFEAMEGRPVIVRTLDIGGDKPPTYLKFPAELNPFLGWRAIRICLDDIPLFKTQLRAILRAAVGHRALIMFPMISSVDELRASSAVLTEVRAELDSNKIEYGREVPVGIMVETPAAAMLADVLAAECDFLSLGTNDLTQYTLAVDRTNGRVAKLFQPLHPAVLRLIKQTIDAAHQRGKWVGMCGELAGMKKAIPILLGLGLDEFSMAPRAIPEAKWLLGRFTRLRAGEIAGQALQCSTAAEINDLMTGVLEEAGPPTKDKPPSS